MTRRRNNESRRLEIKNKMTNYRITDGSKTFYISIRDWEECLLDDLIVDHCELRFCDELDVFKIIELLGDKNITKNYSKEIINNLKNILKIKFDL